MGDEGRLLAAAFAVVPWHAPPRQTPRDGEDYAVAVLPVVDMEPFEAYVDGAGTVGVSQGGISKAASASHRRAHLWGRVSAAFNDLRLHKVKAHCTEADVQAGED